MERKRPPPPEPRGAWFSCPYADCSYHVWVGSGLDRRDGFGYLIDRHSCGNDMILRHMKVCKHRPGLLVPVGGSMRVVG